MRWPCRGSSRGESSARPLFVTATGMSRHQAADPVRHMAAATGYPTLFAVPTLSPAAARPDHDALATGTLIADARVSSVWWANA